MTTETYKLPTGILILVLIGVTACAQIIPQNFYGKKTAKVNVKNESTYSTSGTILSREPVKNIFKLKNLTKYLGGAQIWCKQVSKANGGAHKIYNATVHALICKRAKKKYIIGDTGAGYAGKMLSMAAKNLVLSVKYLWEPKILCVKLLTAMP